jgi:hypothetical protein
MIPDENKLTLEKITVFQVLELIIKVLLRAKNDEHCLSIKKQFLVSPSQNYAFLNQY